MTKELIEKQEIKEKLIEIGKQNGFKVTDNIDKIVNAKYRFFGIDEFRNCPCVKDGEHYCSSQICQTETRVNGVCGCNLYKRS